MECNKDEAIRAKELARKKMQDNDFVGARKIALKAQQLFPELENISHLLAVCHVHCSDKDWYSILQVTKLADEATIKKQYRRLALLLHPDKNNFPGAEAAFKLIGEANVVLSDRGKRSLYDSKLGISIKSGQAKPPTQQGNKNPSTRKPHVFQNNTANGFSNQSSGPNRATPSNPSVSQESFWTCCPFCNIKYQYYRDFVNRALRCPKCSKPFIAYDIAAQGVPPKASPGQAATPGMPPKAGPSRAATQVVPPGTNESQAAAPGVPPRTNQSRAATQGVPPRPNVSQPPSSRQEEKPVQGSHGAVKKETADFPASGSGSQGVGLDSGTQMRNAHVVGSDLKTQKSTKSAGSRSQGVATPRTDKTKREDTNLKDKKRKGVKLEAESSESYDSSCSRDSEDMIIEDSVSDIAADQKSGVNDIYERRRSSRQKHQVTYMESEGEDGDLESPLKRPREGKSSNEKGQQEGLVEDDPQCYTPSKQKRRIDPPTEANMNPATELADGAPENGAKSVKIDDSESDVSSPVVFNCPEPEFNDFDKDKAQSCFAIDQFWACYGNEDGMPRYYAHIRKVYSTGFKLRIMWLEPDPDNEDEIEWVDTELPVGCGKYRRGEYQDTTDHITFSHRIICEKGKKGSFFVYPRKGEIWALFKDWNIKWSTEPEKHANYIFEIVEVLTDFVKGVGIRAVLLDKVKGFTSLFYHGSQNMTGEFVIPPNELYRFSHKIPFFKMTGTERKGVPEGSFELDPASLPANPDDICYPSMFKMDNKTLGTRGNSLLPELSPGRSKSKMSDTLVTPKKLDQCNGKRVSDGEGSVLRRSPRGVSTGYKENKQVNASCVSSQSVTANNLNAKEGRSCNAEVSSHQDDSSPRRSDSISSSISPSRTVALEQFHDFKSDRSPGKFEVGQIWALYETDNNLPKVYCQIKKVGVTHILQVALFESCSVSKNGIKPACGAFKLTSGKPRTFGSSSFSHLLDAKMINKYRFEVYPKAGQVWALYKNWKAELTSTDLENCEYDIVEVTRNSDGLINVTSLVPLKGYESVFRSPRKSRSSIGPMDIPENVMARFSHQIPAFLLSNERGRALSGCWELDPAAVPCNVLPAK